MKCAENKRLSWLCGLFVMVALSSAAHGASYEIQADYSPSEESPMVSFSLETDQMVTSYLWEFGDGTISYDAAPFHSYPAPGPYTVTLKLTTMAGQNVTLVEPDLVVIHNQMFFDDFDLPLDATVWDAEAEPNDNRHPYGAGHAMVFAIVRGSQGNQQMPNVGIIVGNDSGASGGDTCEQVVCPDADEGDPEGLFRFDVEIFPLDVPDKTRFALFQLMPSGAVVEGKWESNQVKVRAVLGSQTTVWQSIGSLGWGPARGATSVQGRFEIDFQAASTGAPLGDHFFVNWIPASIPQAEISWGLTSQGAAVWSDLQIGAFGVPGAALDPLGRVWFDNFERLRYSFGGPQ